MKILITNDDGIEAKGLQELFKALNKNHEVYCIAPMGEKSACSNAFSIHRDIKIKKIDHYHYAADGYPADCVSIGLHGRLIPNPDLIISGINHGPNLGDDIFLSGTVGGARTAYIFGKSAIAVSLDAYHCDSDYFADAAHFIDNYIGNMPVVIRNNPFLLNINHPNLPENEIEGIAYTHACKRVYWDTYERDNEGDVFNLRLKGTVQSIEDANCDSLAIKNKYISVTPLNTSITDIQELHSINRQVYNGKY